MLEFLYFDLAKNVLTLSVRFCDVKYTKQKQIHCIILLLWMVYFMKCVSNSPLRCTRVRVPDRSSGTCDVLLWDSSPLFLIEIIRMPVAN